MEFSIFRLLCTGQYLCIMRISTTYIDSNMLFSDSGRPNAHDQPRDVDSFIECCLFGDQIVFGDPEAEFWSFVLWQVGTRNSMEQVSRLFIVQISKNLNFLDWQALRQSSGY